MRSREAVVDKDRESNSGEEAWIQWCLRNVTVGQVGDTACGSLISEGGRMINDGDSHIFEVSVPW